MALSCVFNPFNFGKSDGCIFNIGFLNLLIKLTDKILIKPAKHKISILYFFKILIVFFSKKLILSINVKFLILFFFAKAIPKVFFLLEMTIIILYLDFLSLENLYKLLKFVPFPDRNTATFFVKI